MVPTDLYLLVCKWDLTVRCFPVQQNSLTITDCVGHFSGFLWNSEVSTGNGWRQCERLSPSAEHTAVRALSLPESLSVSGSYINQCSSCNSKISCASLQEGCGSGTEQEQLWHFGCCRWASKSPGSGIHPLGTPLPMLVMVPVFTWEPGAFLQSPSALQRDSAVWGIWGQEGPSLEVGSPAASQCFQCVPVLSHSLACLLLVFIYLPPRCRPRAGWLCRAPSVAWWLLPALSKPCSAGSVSPRGKGRQSCSCESNATTSCHQKRAWL